jgi:hypothetical protein
VKLFNLKNILFCRNTKERKYLKWAEKYINAKISVESIILKMQEIDKIKFLLLDEDQFNLFNVIENQLCSYDSTINSNIHKCWKRQEESEKDKFTKAVLSFKILNQRNFQNLLDVNIKNLLNFG